MSDRKKKNSQNKHTRHNITQAQNLESTDSVNISNEFEELFKTLKTDIEECTKVIHAVEEFKKYVETGLKDGIFDQQDMQWIEEDLKALVADKTHKETEYLKRKEIYEKSVLSLQNILDQRRKIIETADEQTEVFRSRPHLLKKFAQKSATLMKMVEQGKKDLQEPFK